MTTTGRRFSFNMISAVSPRGDFRFMIHEGTVNSSAFITFLKRLLVGAKQPIFLVVDGHSTHKSVAVKKFVSEQNGNLKLFFLPPYSPHLNPDEQVWAHVKRKVSRKLVVDKTDMKRMAIGALRSAQFAKATRQGSRILPSARMPVYWYVTLLSEKLVVSGLAHRHRICKYYVPPGLNDVTYWLG